jgi:hypothetical protein
MLHQISLCSLLCKDEVFAPLLRILLATRTQFFVVRLPRKRTNNGRKEISSNQTGLQASSRNLSEKPAWCGHLEFRSEFPRQSNISLRGFQVKEQIATDKDNINPGVYNICRSRWSFLSTTAGLWSLSHCRPFISWVNTVIWKWHPAPKVLLWACSVGFFSLSQSWKQHITK